MSDNQESQKKYDDAYWQGVLNGSIIDDDEAWKALGFSGKPKPPGATDTKNHESQQR